MLAGCEGGEKKAEQKGENVLEQNAKFIHLQSVSKEMNFICW